MLTSLAMPVAHGTGEHSVSRHDAIYRTLSSSPSVLLTICLANRSPSTRRRTKMGMSTKEATIAGATSMTSIELFMGSVTLVMLIYIFAEIMCRVTNYISKKKYGIDLDEEHTK